MCVGGEMGGKEMTKLGKAGSGRIYPFYTHEPSIKKKGEEGVVNGCIYPGDSTDPDNKRRRVKMNDQEHQRPRVTFRFINNPYTLLPSFIHPGA